MEKMWTVSYKEYLNFEGVKENIKQVKTRKKAQKRSGMASVLVGETLEESVFTMLTKHPDLEVKQLPAQMDIGFGADFQVSFKEDGKNYSFFMDVTLSKKPRVKYLTLKGDTTESWEHAFCYQTESFKAYFGLKEKHSSFFFYEKPVVIMSIEQTEVGAEIGEAHVHNIGQILMSLNNLLKDKGYGARASQLVRPNITFYREEFKRSL